ncbi:GNAT family N-acetyltransferase [Paraglaciecola aquimarina]|uniref:GNAT family N-acetyltransferase n=1 Tax=Paraglaciecola algarum TaxID=3050085 RepID=A0ABS9DB86_9ALTE|nr:GNAT family N-acetyltransferase [Paraglaciecola sp. G1-23]
MFSVKFITSIEKIGQSVWDDIAQDTNPFCKYTFLHALESSKSVGQGSGWFVQHLIIYQNQQAVGILPLYKKTHSYGEYVFDFAWANTYRQYGLTYYPKLVASIPFTPVTGARLMLKPDIDQTEIIPLICEKLQAHIKQNAMSSMHWLFVEEELSNSLAEQNHLKRHSVQFQWFNRDYSSFENYLNHLHSRRRKRIKKERQALLDADVAVKRLHGNALTQEDLAFFYECYQQTYLKRSGHQGYLTKEFFNQIFANMRENLMLVCASKDNTPVASALFVFDNKQLCGRYWGALTEVDKLHFECCYYQGIEFCIEQNISQFNPGTQGEHKILRGFEPTYCYSNHWLKQQAFHEGVERFIKQEDIQLAEYKTNADKLLPFKQLENK